MKLINQGSENTVIRMLGIVLLSIMLTACGNSNSEQNTAKNNEHGSAKDIEVSKGPHGGRLLTSNNFTLELAIFETGVPPEFRAWATLDNQVLKPTDIELTINLNRLSSHENGKVDRIKFKPLSDGKAGDALRGDSVIHEPHSFMVSINAVYQGTKYHWQYDNFEGRTKIEPAVATALEIGTEVSGPIILHETVDVFGQITANTEHVATLRARFEGVIQSVLVSIGDTVQKGQVLANIESNESLNIYSIKAPIAGVITQRNANPGEQTNEPALFVITDTSTVWVNLSIFPGDINRVRTGALVSFAVVGSEQEDVLKRVHGKISFIDVMSQANQSVIARMVVDNKNGQFLPGSYVKAKITVAEHKVSHAVKRSGLQAFRDFTVVYAQVGDEYEVRMLELGKQNSKWVEVLGGLKLGTRYVSENSYVIKADIEKSGASHDH